MHYMLSYRYYDSVTHTDFYVLFVFNTLFLYAKFPSVCMLYKVYLRDYIHVYIYTHEGSIGNVQNEEYIVLQYSSCYY